MREAAVPADPQIDRVQDLWRAPPRMRMGIPQIPVPEKMQMGCKVIGPQPGSLRSEIRLFSLKRANAPGDCCGGPTASSECVRRGLREGNSSGLACDSAVRDATESPGDRELSPFRSGKV